MNAEERLTIASGLVGAQDGSPLIVGRYLEKNLGETFSNKLHHVLYDRARKPVENPLITAIARLCRPSRQREGISAVVTYNFDDLLESALTEADIRCRSIFEEGVVPESDELPIYHVHGRLPQNPLSTASKRLVFSEESYFALQSDHYSWANFEQLKLLRETTCLMLGLSGTDPNLRRLLDIDFRQSKKAKHYICLRRLTVGNLLTADARPKVRTSVAQHFLDVHHTFLEESFATLGLNVIWVDEYRELPDIIEEIRTPFSL
jgi:SIR2-like domain